MNTRDLKRDMASAEAQAGRGLITPTRCPQMYPELQIARVEQATQAIPMEQWCGDARGGRCAHPHHQVVPFRCLGESQAGGGERKEAGVGVGASPGGEILALVSGSH